MKKFIVPSKEKIQNWKSFFAEVFRDEEYQTPMMLEIVSMAMWVSIAGEQQKENARLGLLASSMGFAAELVATGLLEEDLLDEAVEAASDFALSLSCYLNDVSVLQGHEVFKFEGFTGMDMIVKVFANGEFDEMEERACLSG